MIKQAEDNLVAGITIGYDAVITGIFAIEANVYKGLEEYYNAIEELMELFEYQTPRAEIIDVFGAELQNAYLHGVNTGAAEMGIRFSFSSIDFDFLRTFRAQNQRTLVNYFGVIGNKMHAIMRETLAAGHGWQKVRTELRRVLGFSRRKAETIARTELARSAIEGRLNQYNKDISVVPLVEWFAGLDEVHCSGVPQLGITCQQAHGRRVKTKNAHGLIPAHPNCRCVWIPITRSRLNRESRKKMIDKAARESNLENAAAFKILANDLAINKRVTNIEEDKKYRDF
jgi:SPP1 gp7 family putative phage head morphogenesis protein